MPIYKIADLFVEMNPQSPDTVPWYEDYLFDSPRKPDISLNISREKVNYLVDNGLDFTLGTAENKVLGNAFNIELLKYNGGFIHSSAVLYKDKVYLFSASSGVGKSTLTKRLIKALDGAIIINDDKPSFRVIDGKCIVYGTPFAGGTSVNQNLSAELGGVFFLERSDKAELSSVDSIFAITNLLQQTTRVLEEHYSACLLELLGKIIEIYPVYSLKCPNDNSPVKLLLEMLN